MSSDSDRTIDSDELEEIIARSQKEAGNSSGPTKPKHAEKPKRRPSFHDLSDSNSEDEAKEKKHKKKSDSSKSSRQTCKYGTDCERKNPDHFREYDHSDPKKSKHKTSKSNSSSERSRSSGAKRSAESPNHKKRSSDCDSDYEVQRKKKKDKEKKESNSRPKCKYGKTCYRKNPDHIRDFDHEGLYIFAYFSP